MTTYAVTGATGKLGRLVLDEMLQKVAPGVLPVFEMKARRWKILT